MPTYAELLLSAEWQEKRNKIILRDKSECRNCFNERLYADKDLKLAFLKTPHAYYWHYVLGNEIPTYKTVGFFSTSTLIKLVKETNLVAYFLVNDTGNNNIQLVREATAEEIVEYRDIPFELLKKEINCVEEYKPHLLEIVVEIRSRSFFDENSFYRKFSKYLSLISITKQNKLEWKIVKGLNVHHTYYKKDFLPWQYPENSLQTFCQYCHLELHCNNKIPVLDKNNLEIGKLTACSRCGGTGWFPEYKHVQDGICFRCSGARYEELI